MPLLALSLLAACAPEPTAHLSAGDAAPAIRADAPPSIGSSPTTLDIDLEGAYDIVGDVNGDGRDDLVAMSGGIASVFMGRPFGIGRIATRSLVPRFDSGSVIAGVGDVDGDGYDDVAVGFPAARGGRGRVQVFHGTRRGLETRPRITLTITTADGFGSEVAGAGDLNGDGYADMAVYVPGRDRVRVYYGSADGISSGDFTAINAAWHDVTDSVFADGAATGSGMAAGDIDADGYDDLIVSYPGWNSFDGGFYVFSGSSAGVSRTGAFTGYPWAGGSSSYCESTPAMGWAVASGVDMDGDGYENVVAGAPFDNCEGWVYAFSGSASGIDDSTWVEFYAYDYTDYVVSLGETLDAGDFNGDGVGDFTFGGSLATYAEGPFDTSTSSSETWTDPTDITDLSTWSSTYTPQQVRAGDVDGDGYDDVAVARYTTKGTWTIEVYYGAP